MLYNIVMSLVFTIFMELTISILCGVNKKMDLVSIIWINIVTNPITELINLLIKDKYFHFFLILLIEILITVIEWILFKKILKSKNINFLHLSIINNICSYTVGLLFNCFGVEVI